jgi:hypothetical protein
MCNCINEIDELLKQHNTKLVLAMSLRKGVPTKTCIKTEKIETSKRLGPINIVPQCCPFCGAEYIDDAEANTNNINVSIQI